MNKSRREFLKMFGAGAIVITTAPLLAVSGNKKNNEKEENIRVNAFQDPKAIDLETKNYKLDMHSNLQKLLMFLLFSKNFVLAFIIFIVLLVLSLVIIF